MRFKIFWNHFHVVRYTVFAFIICRNVTDNPCNRIIAHSRMTKSAIPFVIVKKQLTKCYDIPYAISCELFASWVLKNDLPFQNLKIKHMQNLSRALGNAPYTPLQKTFFVFVSVSFSVSVSLFVFVSLSLST